MTDTPIKFTDCNKISKPEYTVNLDTIRKQFLQPVVNSERLSTRKQKALANRLERLEKLYYPTDRLDEKLKISPWGAIIDRLGSRKENKAANKELEITIQRINELSEEDEEDEYFEVVNPTEYAIQKATELVSQAASTIAGKFFKAWVSTEDKGGIRLTWSKPGLNKEVRLVIPPVPGEKIYIYHEHQEEYGVQYNISAKTLSSRLSWLNSK
jgi:hypothetical protein